MLSEAGRELVDQYRQRHEQGPYGASSEMHLGQLHQLTVDGGLSVDSVLDYGCGQSRLVDWFCQLNGATAHRYDPAIPAHAEMPEGRYDLVINTDVLEHVREDDLDAVIGRMRSLSDHLYVVVSTRLAHEILPNGENAHCTVHPEEWWIEKLQAHFPSARRVRDLKPETVTMVTWGDF